MKIDVTGLLNHTVDAIDINEIVKFDKEYFEGTDIIRLSDVVVTGIVERTIADNIELKLNIKGEMILPCSITLEEVHHPFNINIEETEEVLEINQNNIDILQVIWQNIVIEIPIKVTSPKSATKTSGDGWSLIEEKE